VKIAYLGPEASFTDLAVRSAFSDDERHPYVTIPECIEAVMEDKVDLAVVPLENALEGSVHITIDYLFHEADLSIVAELTSPIQQHLMIHPKQQEKWQDVQKILSHSHALAQCHKYLHHYFRGVSLEQATSTAAAAKYVSENPEQLIAAIGNRLASEKYRLMIVQEDIHDFHFNHTRFIVLSKYPRTIEIPISKSNGKTTVMVTLPSDRSGALHQVLSAFSWRKINLSKIESRPLKTGLGNYFFIIDIEQQIDDVLIPGAIAEIEALDCGVKILGSYQSYKL
jgi:prephenate dehydratase